MSGRRFPNDPRMMRMVIEDLPLDRDGDCAIVAIAALADISYRDARTAIIASTTRVMESGVANADLARAFRAVSRRSVRRYRHYAGGTLAEFLSRNPRWSGLATVATIGDDKIARGHAVAVLDGIVFNSDDRHLDEYRLLDTYATEIRDGHRFRRYDWKGILV